MWRHRDAKGQRHFTKKAEIGVLQLQAKKHQTLLVATSESPKSFGRFSPMGLRGNMALLTPWCWASGLQNCTIIHFCCSWAHFYIDKIEKYYLFCKMAFGFDLFDVFLMIRFKLCTLSRNINGSDAMFFLLHDMRRPMISGGLIADHMSFDNLLRTLSS